MSHKMREEKPKKRNGFSGLAFAACPFLGLGLGIGLDFMPAALFIGIACAFIAMAVLRPKYGEW